jgi:hypothetical protein
MEHVMVSVQIVVQSRCAAWIWRGGWNFLLTGLTQKTFKFGVFQMLNFQIRDAQPVYLLCFLFIVGFFTYWVFGNIC